MTSPAVRQYLTDDIATIALVAATVRQLSDDVSTMIAASEGVRQRFVVETMDTSAYQAMPTFEADPISNYAALDTSRSRIESDSVRARLKAALRDLRNPRVSWDSEHVVVTVGASLTAERFIAALPENRSLPKVAPDGEGDMMLIWQGRPPACVVTVEDGCLHLVNRPGGLDAEHIDAQPFKGAHIPISVLRFIPLK